MHTKHWRAAASYVALTRQRESAQVFVDRETAGTVGQLAWQMGRGEMRAASMAWATAEELPLALRQREAAAVLGARPASPAESMPAEAGEWLIPPRLSPDGRDSLGRSGSPAEVAAVVAGDPQVRRERAALGDYLRGAYRAPDIAGQRLEELVDRQGWTSASSRVFADPGVLGELRGKTGIFASRAARDERQRATYLVTSVAAGMDGVGKAEAQAAGAHRAAVAAQLKADATGIPRLSAKAEAAVGAKRQAGDDAGRAAAWRAAQADQAVTEELRRFGEAARQRLGPDGMRALLRGEGRAEAGAHRSMPREQGTALDRVAAITDGLRQAEGAAERQASAQREQLGRRQGRGMRM